MNTKYKILKKILTIFFIAIGTLYFTKNSVYALPSYEEALQELKKSEEDRTHYSVSLGEDVICLEKDAPPPQGDYIVTGVSVGDGKGAYLAQSESLKSSTIDIGDNTYNYRQIVSWDVSCYKSAYIQEIIEKANIYDRYCGMYKSALYNQINMPAQIEEITITKDSKIENAKDFLGTYYVIGPLWTDKYKSHYEIKDDAR